MSFRILFKQKLTLKVKFRNLLTKKKTKREELEAVLKAKYLSNDLSKIAKRGKSPKDFVQKLRKIKRVDL